MKALIRNDGETITEDMFIQGIDWKTGLPLTSSYWAGGRYTLIENYNPFEIETESQTPTEYIEKQKRIDALEKELSELKNNR